MRILLAIALLLLVGCPSKEELKGQPAKPGKSPSPVMRALTTKLSRPYPLKEIPAEEFPPEAAAYLEASLNNLMSGGEYAPKDLTLSYMGMVPGCSIGREAILREVEISGESLAPGLIAAYMTTDPENCLKFLQRQVNAGQAGLARAIGPDKEVGIWIYEHLNFSPDDLGTNLMLLDSVVNWELDPEPYISNIRALTKADDPINSARAAGYLVSRGLATLEERQIIIDNLKDEDMGKLTGGIEAIKLMDDPAFADELVSIVAEAELGGLDTSKAPDMRVAFAAYGLSSLGGEQAKMLRLRLLESVSPLIRVEAALGELLQGDPSHWNRFIKSSDYTHVDITPSLQPLDAWHPDLLPYLLEFVDSDILQDRIMVVENLFRYKEHSDDENVKQILNKLLDDPEHIIRERAWFVATFFSDPGYLDKALKVLQDEDESPKVRLAATMCAMQPTIDRINGRD